MEHYGRGGGGEGGGVNHVGSSEREQPIKSLVVGREEVNNQSNFMIIDH
jgi:hypothetical protein